jgi:hypothetical protein
MTTQVDELITLAEAMADAEADYREALRIDVGVQEASQAFLAARAALRAAIEEAVAWRSFGEQVPERGTDCLIVSQEPWEKKPSVKMDRWDEQYEAPVSFSSATISIGDGWDGDSYGVTHWRPLPAPPALQQMEGER